MLRFLPLVFKNSLRNRRRSILTILSIAASLCLLGVLLAMYHAFYFSEPSPEQALRLVVRNRISLANVLPVSYQQRIEKVPGVREVAIAQWFGGIYKDTDFKNFFARFATEPEKLFRVYPEYQTSEEQKRAFLSERTAAMVGRPLVERFGWKLGDKITLIGDIYPVNLELTIRAIYDARRDNENLFFHYQYLRESLPAERRDLVSTFVVLAESPAVIDRVAAEIDSMFRNSPQQTKTETERAFELSFLSYLGNVKLFLLAVCGAVTFTLLLVSGNTMAMSVRERVREVGILKTVGFTPGGVLFLIVGEAVLIALAGAVLGLLFAHGICEIIRQGPITFADLKALHVPPAVMAFGLGLAGFVGVLSSFIPAWGASRRSIVECLRFTD
jgi:putative ABC transport system permease protein